MAHLASENESVCELVNKLLNVSELVNELVCYK